MERLVGEGDHLLIISWGFHGEFMGNSWGNHGEFMRFDGDFMRFDGDFMGIYMTLPDLWVPQLMASLVVIDSTMITIVDDMEVS